MDMYGSVDRLTGSFVETDLTVGEVLGGWRELTDLDICCMRRGGDTNDEDDLIPQTDIDELDEYDD